MSKRSFTAIGPPSLVDLSCEAVLPGLLKAEPDKFIAMLTENSEVKNKLVHELIKKPRRPRGVPASTDHVEVTMLYGKAWQPPRMVCATHGEVGLHRVTLEMGMLPYKIRAAVEEACRLHATGRLTDFSGDRHEDGGVVELRSLKSRSGTMVTDVLAELYEESLRLAMADEDVPDEVTVALERGEGVDPGDYTQPGTLQHDAWAWFLSGEDAGDLLHEFDDERTAFAEEILEAAAAPPPAHAARQRVEMDPTAHFAQVPVLRLVMEA